MTERLEEIAGRLNLFSDDFYEHFRDVLTGNALDDAYALQKPGAVTKFGNECSLEMLESVAINIENNHKFVSEIVEPWGWDTSDLQLIHSRLHLHMQAEINIKIDIIWAVDALDEPDQPFEYSAIAVFFEDNAKGDIDDPNFDPTHNANWAEFLYDMGVGPDPYGGSDN